LTTILFLCTGNTCRSPMAACLFNALVRKAGLTDVQALSAGLDTWDGLPASSGARNAMERRGLSLDGHLSQRLTPELAQLADHIVCVSQRHAAEVWVRHPDAKGVSCFSPAIPDPYGGDDERYEQCAQALEVQVSTLFHLMETERRTSR